MTVTRFRKSSLFRFVSLMVLAAFIGLLGGQPSFAQVAIVMPAVGQMLHVTRPFDPPQIVGLKIDLKDPFSFDFIMDQGENSMPDGVMKEEFNKIIKYFLVSLAMPNKEMWVNLSPYESKRIIPEVFAQTEMGHDLLAQDYILKQFTASLMYPENGLGKKFWDKVYTKAQERFGTTDININTFNKVWIVADHADVYQKDDTAFLIDSHLKVMLEQDYMALVHHKVQFEDAKTRMASQLVREIIIPAIEKEVNEGKNFATVRQVYNAEIMATWFKKTLRESLLAQVFANKSKIAGQKVSDPQAMKKIYKQYLKAYKKGVFNYIKEDISPDGQSIPRKYFSGGLFGVDERIIKTPDQAIVKDWAMRAVKRALLVVGAFFVAGHTLFAANLGDNTWESAKSIPTFEKGAARLMDLHKLKPWRKKAIPKVETGKRVKTTADRMKARRITVKADIATSAQDSKAEQKAKIIFSEHQAAKAAQEAKIIADEHQGEKTAQEAKVIAEEHQAAKVAADTAEEERSKSPMAQTAKKPAMATIIQTAQTPLPATTVVIPPSTYFVSPPLNIPSQEDKQLSEKMALKHKSIDFLLKSQDELKAINKAFNRNSEKDKATAEFFRIKLNNWKKQRLDQLPYYLDQLTDKKEVQKLSDLMKRQFDEMTRAIEVKNYTKAYEIATAVGILAAIVIGRLLAGSQLRKISIVPKRRSDSVDLTGAKNGNTGHAGNGSLETRRIAGISNNTLSVEPVLQENLRQAFADGILAKISTLDERVEWDVNVRIAKSYLLKWVNSKGGIDPGEMAFLRSILDQLAIDYNPNGFEIPYPSVKPRQAPSSHFETQASEDQSKINAGKAPLILTATAAGFLGLTHPLPSVNGQALAGTSVGVAVNAPIVKGASYDGMPINPLEKLDRQISDAQRNLDRAKQQLKSKSSIAGYKGWVTRQKNLKAKYYALWNHKADNGGIDLSDENLVINIKVDGTGMPLQAQYQDKSMLNLNGLTSIIRRITLLTPQNVPALYELLKS